jgi:predicted kinase
MKTLFMAKGLPASGKTTAAKAYMAATPGTKRVNKDDLRAMIDGGKWSNANEDFVIGLRDVIIYEALRAGHHIIVDDTNLAPKHKKRLQELAHQYNATFNDKAFDFTSVGVDDCIRRDLNRPNSVGERVIKDMYDRYLRVDVVPPEHDPELPNTILVDVDGTVAEMHNRGPFEWDKVGQDKPRNTMIHVIGGARVALSAYPTFISGRDEICRDATVEWLTKHAVRLSWGNHLLMRPQGDMRRDSIVKRELYETYIKGKYNVVAIFDDRPQVIRECWQALGFGDRIFNVGTGREF